MMSRESTNGPLNSSMEVEPRLSVIVTTRNDDHGGDPLARLVAHLRFLSRATGLARILTEEVIVEWNPPLDRPRLADALPLEGIEHEFFSVRIVTVEPDDHAQLPNSDRLPLFQMIAKNVGIRAACAPLILTTNIDTLIGSEVLRRAAMTVPGEVVTATRVDVEGWQLEGVDGVADDGRQLWPHVVAVNAPLGTAIGLPAWIRTLLGRNPTARSAQILDASMTACFVHLFRFPSSIGLSLLAAFLRWARSRSRTRIPLRLRIVAIRLRMVARTMACGDFMLLHRDDWCALGGFPSWPVYSWHMDSILLYQAILSGRRPRHLRMPAAVWHLNHDVGSGYSPSQPTALHERLDSQGIPWIDDSALALMLYGLMLGPTTRLNLDDLIAAQHE